MAPRPFVNRDFSVACPAGTEQPGAGRCCRWGTERIRKGRERRVPALLWLDARFEVAEGLAFEFDEAVKVGSRREGVNCERGCALVFAEVSEHVDEDPPHCARRSQCATVPAIRDQWASARDQLIHAPREAHGQPAYAPEQCLPIGSFDNEVEMVVLHRKMHDLKASLPALVSLAQHHSNGWKHELRAQRPKCGAQRDMHGFRPTMLWAH